MAYTALYRKWRPPVFDDVKGQDPIVSALRNQIKTGRIGHAYLFCGTRGTGKTSVAKIFARAVNCENPDRGNPCNVCKSCIAVNEGNSVNVIELDAASNNGVDDVREIREEVRYAPTEGNYKVFIIDEVHMLSNSAFNALLKTLEEPPSHAIFILATTEMHKLPITVLSRCQRYDFRRISSEVIARRLKELTDGEGVAIEERALRYIARKADGSLRDSISLLDQCIAFHFDETLTYQGVLEVLGAVSYDLFGELLSSVLEQRARDCIGLIDEIVMQGRELSQLVSDFIWYLRNLMLLKATNMDPDALEVSEEDMAALIAMSKRVSEAALIRYIRIFSDLSAKIRNVTDKRVLLEITFINLMHPENENSLDAVLSRIEMLENKLKNGFVPANNQHQEDYDDGLFDMYGDEMGTSVQGAGQMEETVEISRSQMDIYNVLKNSWSTFAKQAQSHLAEMVFRETYPEPGSGDNQFLAVMTNPVKANLVEPSTIAEMVRAIKAVSGIDCDLRFVCREVTQKAKNFTTAEEVSTIFDFPVEEVTD